MIKKILLFHHFNVCNNTFNDYTELIKKELCRRDINFEIIDLLQPSEIVQENIEKTLENGIDAALSFNTAGQHNAVDNKGINLFDKYGVPFFNWIMDSPIDLMGGWKSNCKNLYFL